MFNYLQNRQLNNYLELFPAIRCNLFCFKKNKKGFPLLSGLERDIKIKTIRKVYKSKSSF
jgi:hypothetical protein